MTADGPVGIRLAGWGWRHAGRAEWALRGVDLRIDPGERVLLLGPSGAGKSTLLAALAGLLDDTTSGESAGLLEVAGRPAAAAREQVGLVLQDPDSQLVMARAGDDVAFGLENRGVPREQIWPQVDWALQTAAFPYGQAHPTRALSGGERQRLALAGVIALRPGLLLLDEPTANLDPEGALTVRAALRRILDASGATLLLVEHRVGEALELIDRVVVLEPGGGVIADGAPEQVFATYGDELARRGVWVPGHTSVGHVPRTGAVGAELLSAREAGFRYRDASRSALIDADVTLHAGEAVAALGPNGSGKSTLAMLLAGLRSPTTGRIRGTTELADADAAAPVHKWRARRLVGRIGTVFQNPEHQFLTGRVADELAVGPLRAGLGDDTAHRRATELLERLHLAQLAEANPYTLSGGEKRRLSVATALATAPQVLVLDEPTFGQDLRTWSELLSLLAALRDEGRALFVVTHDTDFVDALADRVLPMKDGRVLP